MTSGSTINVERVLAEEVDGEKTFVKRRERKEGCVEMAVVFRNTMGNEWGDEFANALIRFPSDLEVESQYVKEATSFPEAYHRVQFIRNPLHCSRSSGPRFSRKPRRCIKLKA